VASADLLYICITAFAAVFVVLTVLALLMRLILALFPERDGDDAAVVAAVTAVALTLYPGTRVTKIEEQE